MNMKIICVIYILLLLPLYILKENQNGAIKAVPYKLTLSGLFCIVGVVGLLNGEVTFFKTLIVFGLVFSLIGDYYLAFIKEEEQKFIKGILSFAIAQVCYILMMVISKGICLWEVVLTILFMGAVMFGIYKIKLHMGKVEILLLAYLFLVTFMGIKAGLMACSENTKYLNQGLFSIGAVLFWISDILLGVRQFIKPKKILSYLVSICYFIGQLLIALSIYFGNQNIYEFFKKMMKCI